jgi:hypothetical protein
MFECCSVADTNFRLAFESKGPILRTDWSLTASAFPCVTFTTPAIASDELVSARDLKQLQTLELIAYNSVTLTRRFRERLAVLNCDNASRVLDQTGTV